MPQPPRRRSAELNRLVRHGLSFQGTVNHGSGALRISNGPAFAPTATQYLPLSPFPPAPSQSQQQGKIRAATGKIAMPLAAQEAPVAILVFDAAKVGAKTVSRWLMLAYDDEFSIKYLTQNKSSSQNLRPSQGPRRAQGPGEHP
jgi:hypothetical protein